MANEIQELLNEIVDERLKARLATAIGELRKTKRFGLVFEEHIPELVPIYAAKVRNQARVARKDKALTDTFIVKRVTNGIAVVTPERGDDNEQRIPIDELVVVKRFGEAIFPVLRPVESVLRGGDTPHHMLIEADNYHALQLLEWLYAGKVDCIYIDPPYNTGARDWKYNNDYVDENDGWRHSKGLAFMEKRLKLAHRLLKPDTGVLIVTDEGIPSSQRQPTGVSARARTSVQPGALPTSCSACQAVWGGSGRRHSPHTRLVPQSPNPHLRGIFMSGDTLHH